MVLIVANTQWADCIPKWLIERITDNYTDDGYSDYEMLAYLQTASLTAPLDYDYSEIFFYLTRKIFLKEGKEIPDFLKENNEISDYRISLLEDLRRKLSNKKKKMKRS